MPTFTTLLTVLPTMVSQYEREALRYGSILLRDNVFILLYFYNLHVDVTRQLYSTDMTIKTYFELSTPLIKPV